MAIFMYNVGKCVIYIYIIVHFLKMSECTKIMRTCTIKKNMGPRSIYWHRVSLHVVIEKLEAIIKIIEWNCFHFDFEHGEYISNHTLKRLRKETTTKRNIYLNQTQLVKWLPFVPGLFTCVRSPDKLLVPWNSVGSTIQITVVLWKFTSIIVL